MISGIKIYKAFSYIYIEFLGNELLHVKHSEVSGLNRYLFYPRAYIDFGYRRYVLVRYYKKIHHRVDPTYIPVIRIRNAVDNGERFIINYFSELKDIDWKVFIHGLINMLKTAGASLSFEFSPIPWLLENIENYPYDGLKIWETKCNISIEKEFDFKTYWDNSVFTYNIFQEFLKLHCFNREKTVSYRNQGDLLQKRWAVTTFHI